MKKSEAEIEKLIRPNILALKPYRCARDDYDSGILLDANENSLGSNIGDEDDLHRYPSPYQEAFKEKFARFRSVNPNQIFTGNGSDEPIDLLIRIFCRPGNDAIITTPPTYGMYKVSAGVNDVENVEIPLTPDFQPQTDKILEAADERTKILFLCSPNNPTGNLLKQTDVVRLAEEFPGIVVIDEAYIDFATTDSWASKLSHFDNLVVLQTLSKSFGLAGIRLGVALSSPYIIDMMNRVKAPYNINKLTSKAANEALEHIDKMHESVEELLAQRKRLERELAKRKYVKHIFPSDANFLLFRIENALKIYREIADSGVVIRYRGDQIHCDDCLRVTVGTEDENTAFLEHLDQLNA